jgi:hypothetical protein
MAQVETHEITLEDGHKVVVEYIHDPTRLSPAAMLNKLLDLLNEQVVTCDETGAFERGTVIPAISGDEPVLTWPGSEEARAVMIDYGRSQAIVPVEELVGKIVEDC